MQLRLPGFDTGALVELGTRVRDLYLAGADTPDRIRSVVNDAYLAELAAAIVGSFGGRVGIAPRIYLKKLIGDVLDRVDQFGDFDPRRHYALTLRPEELSEVERNAAAPAGVDEVELELP